jgi:atrial natriuretic peptide receptor A/atrial natriuretic peptide receptor B
MYVTTGMTGSVIMDRNGDREPDYWITDMASNGSFIKIIEVTNVNVNNLVSIEPI